MKVAIVGSRDYPNIVKVKSRINALAVKAGGASNLTIVSGGARGVDSVAENQARRLGANIEVFPADWETHGKKAGFLRNVQIVDAADMVIAFWTGESPGTRHSIDLALAKRKTLEVHFP